MPPPPNNLRDRGAKILQIESGKSLPDEVTAEGSGQVRRCMPCRPQGTLGRQDAGRLRAKAGRDFRQMLLPRDTANPVILLLCAGFAQVPCNARRRSLQRQRRHKTLREAGGPERSHPADEGGWEIVPRGVLGRHQSRPANAGATS